MTRPYSSIMRIAALALNVLTCSVGGAMAQQKSLKEQIVGTWSLVTADTLQSDGSRTPLYGQNPKGIAVFDSGGHYVLQLTNPSIPKFASNNRTTGTPEENKAVIQGLLAHFGTYTVNDEARTYTLHIESSSFPNWAGIEQTRPFTIEGDNLKWVTAASSGGGTSELAWKRAR